MTVRVLFFAYLRERCGVREAAIDLPEGATVSDLWSRLLSRFDKLPAEPPRFAVNRLYVDKAHPLHDNDELALIPPVSGG
ncbi:MAG: molybdopterin converting factor subunit 1 [Candidatus Binatia bacterium]